MIEFDKDDYLAPFEAKRSCVSSISSDWFIRTMAQVYKFGIYVTFRVAIVTEKWPPK